MVGPGNGSITVAVRVRPPTQWEAGRLPAPCYESTFRGDGALATPGRTAASHSMLRSVVDIIDDRILTFDPKETDSAKAFVERGFVPPGTKRYKDRRFMFDRVFNGEAQQQDVYEMTAQPLLDRVLDGYNATVFAYGATGCGKTHTISGTEADPGIIYRTMADLFQRIEDRKAEYDTEICVTFLEIYNEEIRDLLADAGTPTPRGGLCIREDKSVKVVGLVELKPTSADEVKEIVILGNTRRTQSPTHANETSSRSHAVLQVHVTQSPHTAGLSEQRTMGTLSIIDLAGSERAAATTNMGQRMIEGANINKSLLALGNCINALCENGGLVRHIPYRNSKLTRLLKFSLGGNCKTVMIVCVAPASNHFDDTHNTLIYAERATKIKTKVITRNVLNVDRHVGQYVEAINRLNLEVADLKAKLAGKSMAENNIAKRKKADEHAEVERSKNDMRSRVDQTQSSIVEGAACASKLSVARAKLGLIHARLQAIDKLGSPLPPDLEAERSLLLELAQPEERAVMSNSSLNTQIQRSSNSRNMLDATLRAVSERRSDKLDEVSVDNVKLDARRHKAEIEALAAEAQRSVMQNAVDDMAQVMVGLISMLGRCTVMVGEASQALNNPPEGDFESTAKRVGHALSNVKQKNDETFKELLGHGTPVYTPDPSNTSINNFSGYGTSFEHRSAAPLKRSDVVRQNTSHQPASPIRRTPRRSVRNSISAQPYRRVSDKEKKGKPAKNVQWRDEAGQGRLAEGNSTVLLDAPPISIIPSTPGDDVFTANSSASTSTSSARKSPMLRPGSVAGSESEWEDENERTDDSMSFSMSLPASTKDLRSYGTLPNNRRPRASRLDPGFLKSKSKGSALGSLAEDDEVGSSSERRSSQPFGDRMNIDEMYPTSPTKRKTSDERKSQGPSTPRSASSSAAMKGRRRSNAGGARPEKGKRRSSLIPQLSPPQNGGERERDNRPRRVLLASPGKKARRISLSKGGNTSMRRQLAAPNLSFVDGGDVSFSGKSSGKPAWK